MDKDKVEKYKAELAREAAAFAGKVRAFSEAHNLTEPQARQALLAGAGLDQILRKVKDLRETNEIPEDIEQLDIDGPFNGMSLGEAFLAKSERSLNLALEAANQGDFFSAFIRSVDVISEVELALDLVAEERRKNQASRAANARHIGNVQKKEEAHALFLSRQWRFKADAARAIEKEFHVSYKTAERWVIEWTRGGSLHA
ncbi:hypothetical protein HBF26_18185 [Luteibacter jiangsuensis]|uniref:Helix-turn-helix domain-containing protein n=1 Tax=Luteibacter jiangsuensis TaxID=637577 RepID=A0ABX0Q932_9GAMM|nr:hypothetical protein [Luteibacter jiangsuensis]NID06821.1 hypothetical protein [Luteibacter jiangsuensis]